ncbi:MAG: porin family protein [Alphaproteobacteria bacterium]|nr:porin family protein [Alphaproteobacteria bacterium]MBT5390202.1 porin family protein [Alphaproteobacteria bacterium]MBT5540434.1 porin family protein [Alphaproteobacteria bacterium]MBT5654975.1 porin family protein [Alphaproteobacteria bacterium]
MKKMCPFLSVAIACAGISVASTAAATAESALNGWYAGFGVGYQHLKSNGNAKFRLTGAGSFSSATSDMKESGALGDVHVGYSEAGTSVRDLYYGGKLLIQIPTAHASNKVEFSNAEFENKLKQDVNGSLMAQLGLLAASETAIYATLGVSYGYFTYKHVETGSTVSKWRFGFPFGLGVRKTIDEGVSVSLEGVYTFFNSFTTKDLDSSNVEYIAKASPRTFSATVGISWTF